jgi:hypothetical protein
MGIYRQATAPAYEAGGLWFDSDDNDKPYYGDGGSWVALNAGTLFAAFSDTDHVQDADIFVGQRGAGGVNLTGSQFFAVSSLGYYHAKPRTTAVSAYNLVLESAQGGYGAGLSFQSKLSGSGALQEMARITSDAENSWNSSDANTQDASLRFFTTLNGVLDQRMRIQPDGNVGIGTPAPQDKLHVHGGATFFTSTTDRLIIAPQTGYNGALLLTVNEANNAYRPTILDNSGTVFRISGTERARIDGNGNLLVGTLSATVFNTANSGHVLEANGTAQHSRSGFAALLLNRTASDGTITEFFRQGSQVGSISVTATATSYNTSSDYRLKDEIEPIANSGEFIDALKPRKGIWKADGSPFAGFLAHEFAEVSPSSVAGEKDAEDEAGKPIYQSMQASSPEVMANIIAELQSLRRRVAELEARQ